MGDNRRNDRRAVRHRIGEAERAFSTHRVEGERDRRAAGREGDARRGFFIVEENEIRPVLLQLVDQFRPPHDADRAQAQRVRDLDDGATDAGVARILQNEVAFPEVREITRSA